MVVVVSGPDGGEQGSDHGHQPEGHHDGSTVRLLRPRLSRVVGRRAGCLIQSFCHVYGKASLKTIFVLCVLSKLTHLCCSYTKYKNVYLILSFYTIAVLACMFQ